MQPPGKLAHRATCQSRGDHCEGPRRRRARPGGSIPAGGRASSAVPPSAGTTPRSSATATSPNAIRR